MHRRRSQLRTDVIAVHLDRRSRQLPERVSTKSAKPRLHAPPSPLDTGGLLSIISTSVLARCTYASLPDPATSRPPRLAAAAHTNAPSLSMSITVKLVPAIGALASNTEA